MEKLLLLTVMFASCCAADKDLSGKVFVFPKEGDHVILSPNKTIISSASVCLRFFTDIDGNHGIFSFSTPSHHDALVLFRVGSGPIIRMRAQDCSTDFLSLPLPPNTWHSLCATWWSDSGVAQLWVDGRPSVKRSIHAGRPPAATAPVVTTPFAVLGKGQDPFNKWWGAYDEFLPFVGFISDVHMWDHVVPAAVARDFANGENFTPGNVFNWRALDYEISGLVLVEERP